ncbi:GNAT family N-acetyltransferase [Cellulomonas sp. zg-ZUI222]|uniref:GNAT family N-acetyltransferase n=1 Tax=Cellulomonas wangleii TaxID=2816956 RepID=A0ABX8D979_9CELL|nr:GNAT family N-acetyltransferase [Cellulomonas wangleii]MBO0921495.1 GNAT family N-acetyltransferase [Cellulomonas wangleii]MBO0924991.1 GNAT family N-acetyltransferase [Cellulomonas wangleii]QVI63588.1 GNAT family N-acetyltransferase [Cellulomonas wangleii]
MTAPGYRTLVVPAARLDEYRRAAALTFPMVGDPLLDDSLPFAVPPERAVAVEAPDGQLVATHGSYPFRLPLPGGAVRCAGLTWVGVRPDHRRRGLMTSMLRAHAERSLARGEPVSALFAAEAAIYGRFGYGSACDEVRLTLPRGAALRPVEGSSGLAVQVERFDAATHADLVEDVHVRAGAGRPGWIARTPRALRDRVLADRPAARGGAEPLLLATVRRGDDVRALALLARREEADETGPRFTVQVRQASTLDPAATHRLWSVLLDLDLTASVTTPALPVDDPLLQLLVDPRPGRRRVTDNLWVRVLDLPAALGARRYAARLDVVLDVGDAFLPRNAGRWRLVTDADGAAEVTRTDAEPDVRLDVRELGAMLLGGRSAAALATAGLLDGPADAVDRLAVAFGSPLAPVCPWLF